MTEELEYKINYSLLEDGYWQTELTIVDANGFIQAQVFFQAVNRVKKNVLMGVVRNLVSIVKSSSEVIE